MCIGKSILAVLAVSFLVSLTGCDESAQRNTVNVVVEGDEPLKVAVEQLVKEHPFIVSPRSGTEYKMRVVEPDPDIDYRIIVVESDPDVDYKLIVVDPTCGREEPNLSRKLGEAIRKALRDKKRRRE